MNFVNWLLYGLAALAALGVVGFVYRRRETAGPGRSLLVVFRWLVLAVVLLLLFDPRLPAASRVGRRTMALVDGSLSMQLPAGAAAPRGTTRWQRAVAEARRVGGPVLVFGDATRPVRPDSLAALVPTAGESRLLPALQAASEAGVGRAVVITDGGIQDTASVARWLPRLGLDVEMRRVVDAPVPNRALAEVEAAPWAEGAKPFSVRASVAATPGTSGPVTVVVRQGAKVLAQQAVNTPAPGRLQAATLTFTPEAPKGGGVVRYDVSIQGGDDVPADDARSIYVFVGEHPAGIALISFQPDWEPRFLAPVLEQALGLPVRGFLQIAPGRYVTVGSGLESGHAATDADVRRALAEAELVVLHAVGPAAPAWAKDAARSGARVLAFPTGSGADVGLPVTLGSPIQAEWYLAPEVPPSPLAPLLTPLPSTDGIPPLGSLHPVQPPAGSWAPLMAGRGRRGGAASPIAVAGTTGDRRWVVATGDGYWQWAFRGGDGRDLYRRLWSALAGWLVQERRPLAAAAIRPVERSVPRGEPIRWSAAGLAADSVRLRVQTEAGAAAADTALPVARGDTATLAALAPGHYRYQARAFSGGKPVASADGAFTVESYSPEFIRPLVASGALRAAGTGLGPEEPAHGQGRPIHATPIPYILILLLLSTEWVLRRRWGLR
ncbi:MAG TPA: VWA domain-containing protein [Longimicrobiales bacterium]|nr:VWA domain-containing protein [Longimicrobiales bacterium]